MTEMEVCFGTCMQWIGCIDLDEYCEREENGATDDERDEACQMLRDVLTSGDEFANDGRRNNQAVNSCIALHVLGYEPCTWFHNLFDDPFIEEKFYDNDVMLFMEHVERVSDYVYKWGPAGKEGRALEFAI